MSLLINQGKQDTSNDNTFEIMVSKHEVAQITKLEMDEKWEDTLKITFKVISDGQYKNRLFWDRISFDPKGEYSWKYRNLRKSAGVPYSESEPAKIDIESLLLNKAVAVELGIRKGQDGTDYQSVKYLTTNVAPVQTPVAQEEVVEEQAEELDVTTDEEVPW